MLYTKFSSSVEKKNVLLIFFLIFSLSIDREIWAKQIEKLHLWLIGVSFWKAILNIDWINFSVCIIHILCSFFDFHPLWFLSLVYLPYCRNFP